VFHIASLRSSPSFCRLPTVRQCSHAHCKICTGSICLSTLETLRPLLCFFFAAQVQGSRSLLDTSISCHGPRTLKVSMSMVGRSYAGPVNVMLGPIPGNRFGEYSSSVSFPVWSRRSCGRFIAVLKDFVILYLIGVVIINT
jgi:hypothetical protein